MKKIFLVLILTFVFVENAFADTLLKALNQAFNNNTELNAERENLNVSEQDLKSQEANIFQVPL